MHVLGNITNKEHFTILLSRTDGIGDVILTLPLACILKKEYPQCKIIFLGKTYTQQVVKCCSCVDSFMNWDILSSLDQENQIRELSQREIDIFIHVFAQKEIARLAYKANIPVRIGSSHRLYNFLYCNVRCNFSRLHSPLHEAQLNLKLAYALLHKPNYSLEEITNSLSFVAPNIATPADKLLSAEKTNIILHPKSNKSAREWGEKNFNTLIDLLPEDKYNIFITGTKAEGDQIRESIINANQTKVHDLTGLFSLEEMIAFISKTDCLVACSTGVLHIAAVLNKKAIGLYPPMRPMYPKRWAPIGTRVKVLCKNKRCKACKHSTHCQCIESISPQEVLKTLEK